MIAGLLLLMLTADGGQPEQVLKTAKGVVWVIRTERDVAAGQYVHAFHHLFLREPSGDREVAKVDESSFIQSNPRIAGGTSWQFRLDTVGEFLALQQQTRIEARPDGKDLQTGSTTAFRWDGNALVPVTAPDAGRR